MGACAGARAHRWARSAPGSTLPRRRTSRPHPREALLRRSQPRLAIWLVAVFAPALQLLAQVAQEATSEGAVDQAVVVRERDVHDRADRDHVLPELVLDDPRPLHERVGAE